MTIEKSSEAINSEIEATLIIDNVDDAKALVLFAHGAGADKSSDFMAQVTQLLNDAAINVIRFNFNYMDKRLVDGKRYPPDRMPKMLACFSKVIAETDSSLPLFLVGKSMGSRVAATLIEEAFDKVKGVVCIGYPFHPPKKPDKLRLEPLQKNKKPVLILQGDRDALGNQEEVNQYQLSQLCQVEFFADGDHNLKPRVRSGFTHKEHLDRAVLSIRKFIDEHA